MDTLKSKADPRSAGFQANAQHHRKLAEDLRARVDGARKGGPDAAAATQKKRGKLPARERVARLLDPDTPFLELSALAAWGLHEGEAPSAGIVTGIGRVSGRECLVIANDPSVKGGSYFPETIRKHVRAQEIALDNRLPAIYTLRVSTNVTLEANLQVHHEPATANYNGCCALSISFNMNSRNPIIKNSNACYRCCNMCCTQLTPR